jgi:hypothetical protein
VLGGEQFREGAVDFVADDFLVGDEDVFEDGLVEFAADLVAGVQVEGVRVFEQFQVGFEERGTFAEVVGYGVEFDAKFLPLPADVREACTDLALRQSSLPLRFATLWTLPWRALSRRVRIPGERSIESVGCESSRIDSRGTEGGTFGNCLLGSTPGSPPG